jgi:curved DNA-binding protein CbpA
MKPIIINAIELGHSKQQWLEAFENLKKRHDLEWGAFFKAYKEQFNLSDRKIAKDFNVSQPTVTNKLNLYIDYKEAEKYKLEKEMPTKSSVNSALGSGIPVKEKVAKLATVAEKLDKPIDKVTAQDITKNYNDKNFINIRKNYNNDIISNERVQNLVDSFTFDKFEEILHGLYEAVEAVEWFMRTQHEYTASNGKIAKAVNKFDTKFRQAMRYLKLDEGAKYEEVKAEYRKMARVVHPDTKEGSEEEMQKLNDAFETIKEYRKWKTKN